MTRTQQRQMVSIDHTPETWGYLRLSRDWATNLVLMLPLLLVYELGVIFCHQPPTAGADMIKDPLSLLGRSGMMIFNLLVVAAFTIAFLHLRQRRTLRLTVFPPMVMEAFLYALLLAPLVQVLTGRPLDAALPGVPHHVSAGIVIAAAGAGVYEELVFRVVLLGLLYLIAARVFHLKPAVAGGIAVVVAAAVFSLMHFVAHAPSLGLFWYRFVAGLLLSIIFLSRGMAIACYTHALYNIMMTQVTRT